MGSFKPLSPEQPRVETAEAARGTQTGTALQATGARFKRKQEGNGPIRVASNRAMKMASDLKPATSITLESICILLLKATFMASEALVASK